MENIYHVLLVTVLAIFSINAANLYEDSSTLCSKCSCYEKSVNRTLYINCTSVKVKNVPANWPNETEHVVATFSNNDIYRLEQFPGSGSKLTLVFDHCGIKELHSGLFESSINVFYFDISYNELTSDQLSADVFKGPYNDSAFEPINLEYLNLAYNKIHSLHKNIFEHTTKLKYLNLEGNHFRVLDDLTTLAFVSIPQLQIFNIANNGLTDVPENALVSFKNLTELDISNNDLDFVPFSIALLHNLQILHIDNNPIILLDDETFLGLDNLLELTARNLTEMERIKTNTFAPLKKLQKLDLSFNSKLQHLDEQAFQPIEKLRELYMSNTQLRSLWPGALNWAELRVLDLSDNHLFCDCNLYNISTLLVDDIKMNKNGPYCKDIRTSLSLEIYSLTSDVCSIKDIPTEDSFTHIHGNMKILRLSLVMLTVVLIVATFIAGLLGYSKWRAWQRNQAYPFTSRIVYNPITTNVHF